MRFGGWSRKLAVVAIATAATVGAPVAAVSETLADAMVAAYKHNGLIDQNRALLRAADEDVAQAVSALKPILNWSGDITYSKSEFRSQALNAFGAVPSPITQKGTEATIGIALELLLYDFGKSLMSVDMAKEAVLGTRQSLVAAEQTVLLNAVAAFMEVRRQREFVRLRQNNVRVITEEMRAAKDRFEVGEVTRTDVALAEARLAAARSTLAAAQGSHAQAIEMFRAAIGHKPGSLAPPPRVPSTAKSLESAKATALKLHPEMLKTRHDVKAAELAVLVAEASMKPTVKLKAGLQASQTFGDARFSNSGSAGVEVSGPIYQGGRLASIVRKAMAQRDQARAGLHIVRHNLAQNVGNAWAQLQVARSSREARDRQVRASRVAFRGVREEATLGARTTLDVLDAEQELLDAQANLISAVVDEHVAAYQLLASMGLLTAERLKLRVPRYDPAEYYNMVKQAPAYYSKQGRKLDKVLKALGKE